MILTPPDIIREFYERLTGKPCEVTPFGVWLNSYRGHWSVHVLGTCEFYDVNWKTESPRR